MAAGDDLRILLRDIRGRELCIQADLQSTVRFLKGKIADAWEVPAVCQKLICGTETLKDSDVLASCVRDGSTLLSMMLVTSLDEARKRLSHSNRHMRLEALKAFAQMAPKGNRGAIVAVSALLSDEASEVRISALEALTHISEHSDERGLAAARLCLSDVRADVRCAALRATTQLAPPGHKESIAALTDCLADLEKSVRATALEQLGQWVPQGNLEALRACTGHLASERLEVRSAGLHALAAVAAPAHEETLEAVGALIEDRENSVKHDVLMVFARLLPDVQARNAAIAVARLMHGRSEVRLGALKALTKMAALQGNSQVITALSGALKNKDRGLRLQALKALLKAAPNGNERALEAVGWCLHDQHAEVRQAALQVLAQMARGGEQAAVSMLGACLEHEDRVVKQNAKTALTHLVPSDEERAVMAAAAGLEHGSEQRKRAAWGELTQMVANGNQQATGMVAKLLSGSDPTLSRQALQMLACSPPIDEESVLAAVFSQLKHPEVQVRLLALTTVVRLARPGHPGAIQSACAALEDSETEVRLGAINALTKLAPKDSQQALAELTPRLNHKSEEVRRTVLVALTRVSSVGSQRAIAAARQLLEDRDYRVRQEAMKALNKLAPEGHENLGIVASSVLHAQFACSSRLMRRKNSASSILGQLGGYLGQQESAVESLESQLSWNECKALSFEATAYRTKATFAANRQQKQAVLKHQRPSRAFADQLLSAQEDEDFLLAFGR